MLLTQYVNVVLDVNLNELIELGVTTVSTCRVLAVWTGRQGYKIS